MPPSDATLEMLLAEQLERPLPTLVPREVRLPHVVGAATVLIGMRRSGKTYRLFAEMAELLAQGAPRSRMLYLNLEDDRLRGADVHTLSRALEIFFRREPGARTEAGWILLDEIQTVPGWESFLRRVLDTERARLYVTGSSARLLSGEVATAFRGRSVTVEVLPFSVREAALAEGLRLMEGGWPPGAARRSQIDAFLDAYLRVGGFPAARGLNAYDRVQMLQEYVELVVLRDVAERHAASNVAVLHELVAALFAANSNGFSLSRLHGALTAQGWKVGKATLLAYLDHLVDAFLFFLLPMRTRSARQRAVHPRKVYAVDPGLAAAMYRGGAWNSGAQLENAVYLELRRRYGRLSESVISWVRTETGQEVDFALDDPVRGGPPELIQVCTRFDAEDTRRREIEALTGAMRETGATASVIVTAVDEERIETDAGLIRVVPAREWFFRWGSATA